MNLPLPALTLPWKMMPDDTSQKASQRPVPPLLQALSSALMRIALHCPVCWRAAHSMTICSTCGAGTGLQMRLGRNQSSVDWSTGFTDAIEMSSIKL